ncbi:MAG: 6-hydroxymethylpterin diphosphokinase MptE-like protein [bacterium]
MTVEQNEFGKNLPAADIRLQQSMWLDNIQGNLDIIPKNKDIKPLRNIFEGVPGCVIGAGPSLDKNIGLLAEHAREYPLFCTDRALRKVYSAGIIPHFVVVIDWQDVVADFFAGLPINKTILLASIKISRRTLELPWKRVHFFLVKDNDKAFEMKEVELTRGRVAGIPGGVICGNSAYLLARWCGCNPITFVGCDMCMESPNEGEINYEAVDPNGNKIYSLPGFLAGLEWLNKYLELDQEVVSGKVKLFNSTEGGIMYGKRLPALSLSEFIENHPGAKSSLQTKIQQASR